MRHTLPCPFAPIAEGAPVPDHLVGAKCVCVRVNLVRPDITRPIIDVMERDSGSFVKAIQEEVRITSDTGGQKGSKPAQFHRLPWDVVTELAEHYGRGAEKYPDPEPGVANWQLGYAWSLNMSALMRHLTAFWLGEDIDEETGSSHLSAVLWHAATLRWFQKHGKGTDDRPRP